MAPGAASRRPPARALLRSPSSSAWTSPLKPSDARSRRSASSSSRGTLEWKGAGAPTDTQESSATARSPSSS
eukprot:4585455-Pyramimonas_sp.AAC.1